MGRDRKKGDTGRDAGGFAAIPWTVFDSPAYARLSHPAKALLMELARQFVRDNNGKLLCSMAHLRPRGWKSNDVITRAKSELLEAGFIFETCKGQRPNRASWYAVTWRTLDRHHGYDHGAVESFERGAYRKNALLTPSPGVGKTSIAPSPGVESAPPAPSPGATRGVFAALSTPSPGDHLDMPSIDSESSTPAAQQSAHETLADLWTAIGGNPAKLWHVGMNGPAAGLRAPVHCKRVKAKALEGDMGAARLLLERVLPPVKAMEPSQPLSLPDGTLTDQGRAVLASVAAGELAPAQGAQLLTAIGTLARVVEIDELAARVAALEGKHHAKP